MAKISKARKGARRTRILVGIFILLVIALCLSQYFLPDIMKPEIWLSILGAYSAIYLGLLKQWMDHDKMFKELFLEFNHRFDKMNEDLNAIVRGDNVSEGKTKEAVIQDYINLCSEEYLWYKIGRIDKEVWDAWKKGIEYYYRNSTDIKAIFNREKAESGSYYRLFTDALEFVKPETNTPEEENKNT
jgi:hypothetical protein